MSISSANLQTYEQTLLGKNISANMTFVKNLLSSLFIQFFIIKQYLCCLVCLTVFFPCFDLSTNTKLSFPVFLKIDGGKLTGVLFVEVLDMV